MIDKDNNSVYIRKDNKLSEWLAEGEEKAFGRLKILIKNYLELDNVSFLFGAGSSIPLGSVSIKNIPKQVEETLKAEEPDDIYNTFSGILRLLTGIEDEAALEREDDEIKYPLEKLLNILESFDFIYENNIQIDNYSHYSSIKKIIKSQMFDLCDLDELPANDKYLDSIDKSNAKLLKENKYSFHEKFVKKILQRPLNLRRVNIFTTNYDLAFEYTFDKLGVYCINGFSGFHNRVFKPELFEHDIYFPGSTTTGKVQRVEKVLRYYKLHGSITWKSSEPEPNNIYGIQEVPIDLVRSQGDFENLLIYPTSNKKSQSLDLPYSELFRQFSSSITQPQSVLFTIGYSFRDEHINDIIQQALSVPSFTLIIIDKYSNDHIKKFIDLDDPRVIVITGEQFGDFVYFVSNLLPDLYDIDIDEKIAQTMKKLYPAKSNEKIDEGGEDE